MYPHLKNSEYQDREFHKKQKSPTQNWKTHDNWASYNVRALNELHKEHAPTHFLTLKMNRLETVEDINQLLQSLGRAILYFNAKNPDKSMSLFGVMNPDEGGIIHYHILARSKNPEIHNWLTAKIRKYNLKYGTIADISYCTEVKDAEAVTAYPFKLGHRNKLLFVKNTGIRHIFALGGYFPETYRKCELSEANLIQFLNSPAALDWIDQKQTEEISVLEIEAEEILGTVEDWLEWASEFPEVIREPVEPEPVEPEPVSSITAESYRQEAERRRVQGERREKRLREERENPEKTPQNRSKGRLETRI